MTSLASSPDLPSATLEQRATDQRQRIHHTVAELEEQFRERVREKLDVKRYVIEYAWPAAGIAALTALLLGYGTAGVIKDMVR